MRQFGEQSNRTREHRLRRSVRGVGACNGLIEFACSHQSEFQQPALGKLLQSCRNVGQDTFARSRIGLCEIVHNVANCCLPSTSFDDLGGDGIGFKYTLGREQYPTAMGLIMN